MSKPVKKSSVRAAQPPQGSESALLRDSSHKDSPEDIKMPLSSSSTSSTKSIRRAPSELERSDSSTVSFGSAFKGIFRVWVELLLRADSLAS